MPRRTLIYGGTGFCGSHLAEACLEAGEEVFVVGRKTRPWIESHRGRICFVEADITRPGEVEEALEQAKPDHIYHLAGLASVARSFIDEADVYRVNVLGTHNILKAIRERRPGARVLVVGSAEEYGPVSPDRLPIKESAPLRPLSPYGVSRVASTLMALREARAQGLDVIATRTFNLVGPRQSRTFIASDFAAQLAEAKAREVKDSIRIRTGNLAVRRDFSSVYDGVRAYRALIEKGQAGAVYNVCSGIATQAQTILDTLAGIAELTVQQDIDPARLRSAEVPEVRGDPGALQEAVGFTPANLDRALHALFQQWLEHFQAHPKAS